MVRIIFVIGLVALVLIGWFLLSPVGRSVSQLHAAALSFAKCIEGHNDEIAGIMRDSGNVTSYNDMEYNQYRAKLKLGEIQSACLEQSGFKTLVLRQLDNTTLSDADKTSIRRELRDAQTVDDLERIETTIESSARTR